MEAVEQNASPISLLLIFHQYFETSILFKRWIVWYSNIALPIFNNKKEIYRIKKTKLLSCLLQILKIKINTIPNIEDKCTLLPYDASPIIHLKCFTFRIETNDYTNFQDPNFINIFDDYIRSMSKWMCLLISHYKTNLLSKSLLYHIQNKILPFSIYR